MNPFNLKSKKTSGASHRFCNLRRVDCARHTPSPPCGGRTQPSMPNPTRDPKVAFHVATTRDVGHRIAQLLAMSELRSPFWLRETMLWMQLLPNRIMRIVLRVAPDDLNRVLSPGQLCASLQVRTRGSQAAQDCGHPLVPLCRGLARRRAAHQHVHGQVARRATGAADQGDQLELGPQALGRGFLQHHQLRGLPQQALPP